MTTAEELKAMDAGTFLAHLGQDGMRWTEAFRALNPDCNVEDGILLSWFCNALCAGEDHGLARAGLLDPMWSRPWDRDSDGSGEAGETQRGSTEGNSAGREAASPTHSDQHPEPHP